MNNSTVRNLLIPTIEASSYWEILDFQGNLVDCDAAVSLVQSFCTNPSAKWIDLRQCCIESPRDFAERLCGHSLEVSRDGKWSLTVSIG